MIKKFVRILPFLVIMLLGGMFSYYFIETPLHEFGHYTFAYAFNKTDIANFTFPYKEAFVTDPFATLHPSLNYKYPMNQSYSIPQIFLISFGGFLFELIYFVIIVTVLYKILLKRKVINFYLASIIIGFYIMFFNMLIGWFDITNINTDVFKVILTFPNIYLGLTFSLAVEFITAIVYIKLLWRFSKDYFTKLNKSYPFR